MFLVSAVAEGGIELIFCMSWSVAKLGTLRGFYSKSMRGIYCN